MTFHRSRPKYAKSQEPGLIDQTIAKITPSKELPSSITLLTQTRESKSIHYEASPYTSHKQVTGRVEIHPRGYGFLVIPSQESAFIPPQMANMLLSGDVIKARIGSHEDGTGELFVEQVDKIWREVSTLMYRVARRRDTLYLYSLNHCSLAVSLEIKASEVQEGDILAVDLPRYDGPLTRSRIQGALRKNLGPKPKNLSVAFERKYAMAESRLDLSWEEQEPTGPLKSSTRTLVFDMTHVPFVTIDSDGAEVLDDALYARKNGELLEVFVAIADVTAFVPEGSALDEQAKQRGASIYFPDSVYSMFPKEVAQACSFEEGQIRQAVVFKVTINSKGEKISTSVNRAFINSAARLNHYKTNKILEGKDSGAKANIVESLSVLKEVFHALSGARSLRGSLTLDETEPVYSLTDQGKWELKPSGRSLADTIVEECMLLVNEVVAKLILELHGEALLRTQSKPSDNSWAVFQDWARTQGALLPHEPNMKAVCDAFSAMDTDVVRTAHSKLAAALSSASYKVLKSGEGDHFSLGLEAYTHATSPLRRYSDVVAHRMLLAEEPWTRKALQGLSRWAEGHSFRMAQAGWAEKKVLEKLRRKGLKDSSKDSCSIQPARVIRQTNRGLRMILPRWQLAGWLMGKDLIQVGYEWDQTGWVKDGRYLSEGDLFDVEVEIPLKEGADIRFSFLKDSKASIH